MRPHNRKMTTRARLYLAIAATRHLIVAALAALLPTTLTESPSFQPITLAAPTWLWSLVFLGAGVACGAGSITRLPKIARLGLMLSATSTAMVTAGLLIAAFTGDLSSYMWPTIFAAMAAKDFTVCADPLRSPFEEWVEEIAAEDLAAEEDRRAL